jgi:hypothetical protein
VRYNTSLIHRPLVSEFQDGRNHDIDGFFGAYAHDTPTIDFSGSAQYNTFQNPEIYVRSRAAVAAACPHMRFVDVPADMDAALRSLDTGKFPSCTSGVVGDGKDDDADGLATGVLDSTTAPVRMNDTIDRAMRPLNVFMRSHAKQSGIVFVVPFAMPLLHTFRCTREIFVRRLAQQRLLGLHQATPASALYARTSRRLRTSGCDGVVSGAGACAVNCFSLVPKLMNAVHPSQSFPLRCMRAMVDAETGAALAPAQSAAQRPDAVFSLVVHVRRGDIVGKGSKKWRNRFVSLSAYVSMIRRVVDMMGGERRVRVFVVSQGSPPDFRQLTSAFAAGVIELVLDTGRYTFGVDVMSTWQLMLDADVLITGISQFSLVAAALGHGIALVTPFLAPHHDLSDIPFTHAVDARHFVDVASPRERNLADAGLKAFEAEFRCRYREVLTLIDASVRSGNATSA